MRKLVLTAVLSSLTTLVALRALGWAPLPAQVRLENQRVRVLELAYASGAARERGVRPTDQLIVFLDDCKYQRTDPKTGEKTVRTRKSGEVIWHNKGEDAPELINIGPAPYRTILVELK